MKHFSILLLTHHKFSVFTLFAIEKVCAFAFHVGVDIAATSTLSSFAFPIIRTARVQAIRSESRQTNLFTRNKVILRTQHYSSSSRSYYSLSTFRRLLHCKSSSSSVEDNSIHKNGDNIEPRSSSNEKMSTTISKNISTSWRKDHAYTVCMVPPSDAIEAWDAITRARTQLRDPGLYRWPPHVNLLYPFVQWKEENKKDENHHDWNHITVSCNNDMDRKDLDINNSISEESQNRKLANQLIDLDTMTHLLSIASEQCEPFHVTVDNLGTFGGQHRGVLWLKPSSSCHNNNNTNDGNTVDDSKLPESNSTDIENEPFIHLQSVLEASFPMCNDVRRQTGNFSPHMTLSHFQSIDDALEAKQRVESWWCQEDDSTLSFYIQEIYVLKRSGDDGQFQIAATVLLGQDIPSKDRVILHNPPRSFPAMPDVEEDWVREERMKLKKRRNGNRRKGGRGGRRRRSRSRSTESNINYDRGPSRSTDTPEQIAQKRAIRAAKKRAQQMQLDATSYINQKDISPSLNDVTHDDIPVALDLQEAKDGREDLGS